MKTHIKAYSFNGHLLLRQLGAIAASFLALSLTACGAGGDATLEGQKVAVSNGYLVFEDSDAFETAEQALSNMNASEKEAWENQFPGFKSMRSDFEIAIRKIDALDNSSGPEASSENPINRAKMDQILMDHPHSVAQLKNTNEESTLRMNIPFKPQGSMVNNLGLVQIGKKLFHYELGATKSASADTAIENLMNATASNTKHGVIFKPTAYYASTVPRQNSKISPVDEPIIEMPHPRPPYDEKPRIKSISQIYGPVSFILEGQPFQMKVLLEKATTQLTPYTFSLSTNFSDRAKTDETTFTNGVYLESSHTSAFPWAIQVPAGVSEFSFTVQTHDNGVINEQEDFFVYIDGISSFPGVDMWDPHYPPTSGVIWQNTHQEKSSDGRDKLYVWEQMSYKRTSRDTVEYIYKKQFDTTHKKKKNSNWTPVESDFTIKTRWFLDPNFYDTRDQVQTFHSITGNSSYEITPVMKKGFAGIPAAHGYIEVDVGYAQIKFYH